MHQWRGILSSPVNNIDYVSLLRTKSISRQRKITDYSIARALRAFLLTMTNVPGHQAHGSGVFQVHDEMRLVLTIYARAAPETVFHLPDKVSGCQLVTALTNRAHCTFNEKWNSKLEKTKSKLVLERASKSNKGEIRISMWNLYLKSDIRAHHFYRASWFIIMRLNLLISILLYIYRYFSRSCNTIINAL